MKKGRNSNGMGGYQTLPSGMIRFVQTVVVLEGQNPRRLTGPSAPMRVAAKDAWDRKLLKLRATSAPVSSKVPTLGQFLATELAPGGRHERLYAPSTNSSVGSVVYESHIRNHPVQGIPLDELTPKHIEDWYTGLGVALSTGARYLGWLKTALQNAVYLDELIAVNPAWVVKAEQPSEEVVKTVLSQDEATGLLGVMALEPSKTQEGRKMAPTTRARARTGAQLMLHTLRRGEACGLRFEDFDGEGITVRRQIQELGGKIHLRKLPKGRRVRWVPIVDPELKAVLMGTKEGWVLHTAKGGPMRPRNLARDMDELLEGSRFEGVTRHDLRSTAGMNLLETGTDIRTAAELMGHDPAVLAKLYARSRPALKVEAMKKARGA